MEVHREVAKVCDVLLEQHHNQQQEQTSRRGDDDGNNNLLQLLEDNNDDDDEQQRSSSRLNRVIRLSYLHPRLNRIDVDYLCSAMMMSSSINIQVLDLYGSLNIKEASTCFRSFLERVLPSHPTLERLNLGNNGIGNNVITGIGRALLVNEVLRVLNLERNGIQSHGFQVLSKAIQRNSTLTQLMVSYNQPGDIGCQAIAVACSNKHNHDASGDDSSCCCGLKIVYLDGCEIIDTQAKTLADGLIRNNTSIVKLVLANNYIGTDGCTSIAASLKHNCTLCELNLKSNTTTTYTTHSSHRNNNSSNIFFDFEDSTLVRGGSNTTAAAAAAAAATTAVPSTTIAAAFESALRHANYSLEKLVLDDDRDGGCTKDDEDDEEDMVVVDEEQEIPTMHNDDNTSSSGAGSFSSTSSSSSSSLQQQYQPSPSWLLNYRHHRHHNQQQHGIIRSLCKRNRHIKKSYRRLNNNYVLQRLFNPYEGLLPTALEFMSEKPDLIFGILKDKPDWYTCTSNK